MSNNPAKKFTQKLIFTPGPHIHAEEKVRDFFWTQSLALLPALIVMIVIQPASRIFILALCFISAAALEIFSAKIFQKKIQFDRGDTLYLAILFALILPSSASFLSVMLAVFFGLFIGRGIFGGLGAHFLQPAALGYIFLYTVFPASVHSPVLLQPAQPFENGLSTALILSLLGGGIFLSWKRKLPAWEVPWIYLGLTAFPGIFLHLGELGWRVLILTAFFLLGDYGTMPLSRSGLRLASALCAVLTLILHHLGILPAPFYAVLMVQLLSPWLDQWALRRR